MYTGLNSLQWLKPKHLFIFLLCIFTTYLSIHADVRNIIVPTATDSTSFDEAESTVELDPEPLHFKQPLLVASKQEAEDSEIEDWSIPPDLIPNNEYVAMCLSVKNEHHDMIEFINHHYHNMGIHRFYIMEYAFLLAPRSRVLTWAL